MRGALDGFVVRGVSSNIAFQAALLAHPRFAAGDFNTGFIAEQYPHGLRRERRRRTAIVAFLLALAVAANRRLLARSAGISGQLAGHELRIGEDFVVVQIDAKGARTETPAERAHGGQRLSRESRRARRAASRSRAHCATSRRAARVDGEPFHAQVERARPGLSASARGGAQVEVRVLSPRAAELQA